MQNHPELFPLYYVHVIRAGEISGTLAESLDLLMGYITWKIEFKKTVKGGLVYPVILLSVMSMAMVIMFTFALPRLLKALSGLGGEPPLSTRIIMSISGFMHDYMAVIIAVFFMLTVLIHFVWRTERGRYTIDSIIIKSYVIGDLVAKIDLSRYFKIVATLHATGVAVGLTFHAGAEVVENQFMAGKLRDVSNELLEGKSISQALKDIDHMPVMVLDMIALAERTGDLDGALTRAGEMLDKEVPEKVKKFMAYFEPLTVVFLGGMVLILLMSVFLPIYKTIGMIRVR
jgi:type II secretory pathway component PulF